jgi:hypothetical protein
MLRKLGLAAGVPASEASDDSDDSFSDSSSSDADDFEFEAEEDEREYFKSLPKWQKMKYKKDQELKQAQSIVNKFHKERRREEEKKQAQLEVECLFSKALAVRNIDLALQMVTDGRVDVNFEDAMGRTITNVISSMGAASLDLTKFKHGFKGAKIKKVLTKLVQYGADLNHENVFGKLNSSYAQCPILCM